jgi:nucleotide-binding universal stress UspA family protein
MESSTPESGRVIIVGVDGSHESEAALRWTMTTGAQPGDTVRAIMVHPSDDLLPGTSFAIQPHGRRPSPAHEYPLADHVTGLRQEIPGSPDVVTVVTRGDPSTELITASADADLLVVGTHQHSAMGEVLLGSVSRECVQYSRCPVVVITPEAAHRLNPATA